MNTLPQVVHSNQRVLTTAQIAVAYETDERRISENFNRNKDRYKEGKHYFCLEGERLKVFGDHYANCVSVERVSKLYLWTKKGAFLHAKSLNTDKAWEAYERLIDEYFDALEQLQQPANLAEIQAAYEQMLTAKEHLTSATAAYRQAQARFHELIEPLGELGKALAQRALGQRKKQLKQSSAKFVQMDSDETATAGPSIEDILSSYMQSVGKPLTTRDIMRCGPPPIRKLRAKEVQDLLEFLEQSGVVSTERKGKVLWYTLVS